MACVAAFVEKDSTARELLAGRAELPLLRHIISLAPTTEVPGVIPFDDLARRGDEHRRAQPDDLALCMAAVAPTDLLTIVYTSGTTAEPKGVMLTHGNVTSNLHNVGLVFHITADDVFLSALPAWPYMAPNSSAQTTKGVRAERTGSMRSASWLQ